MPSLTSADFIALFRAIAERIGEEKDYLCALDGQIGDADHGIAMEQGFAAVAVAHESLDPATASLTEVFNLAARSFLNAVGASSGPLYATAFLRAGAALKDRRELDAEEAPALIEAITEGIRQRGKAEVGDKTMLDAWQPAADAVAAGRAAGRSGPEILAAARAAAEAGAEATKKMVASKGRSSRLGERSLGHMDPGAASAAIIVAVMAEALGRP